MAKDIKTPPLVIFGLDGGDAGFIQRWAQEGYLPTIASIMQRGCRGEISGPELMSTQGAWLSLFSGVSRSEHGYYYNRQLMPGTYDLRNVSVHDTHVLPFWSRLLNGSKKVAIIDALEAEPLPGLPGVQLANWAVQQQYNSAIVPPSAEPASLLSDVHGQVGSPIHIEVFKPNSSFSEDLEAYRLMLKRIEEKGALCRRFLAQDRCDLAVITFVEAHTAAHRLWDYRPEGIRHTDATSEGSKLSTAIREVYQAIDRELGLLLKQLPDESNIFIISLFGMKDLYPTTGLIEAFCRQLEYQAPAHGSLNSVNPLTLLRRAFGPDVRARMSRFLPRRLQMRLETDRFRTETNWAKTKAFSIPALNTSFVRVNLRGREPQGIIEPGPEYERLLSQIEADLRQLVDVRSGKASVERVIRTAEVFRCGPPSVLPDLCVEWKSTPYFMDRVRHPKVELVQARPQYNRSSYHTFSGFVAAAGPSIRAGGDLGEVSPLDFAPAFLSLMGEPFPQRFAKRFMNRFMHHPSLNSRATTMAE
ncbi:MAG: alkaline phosphatase family protein [Nitrospirota bacterium]|nr:alkaline phosphatase family protein [Nitrospirota bacterium]